ncbi:MAG: alpha/beta fold hydrolase [Myxococcales bacterium]|nr:alpha/beta fold hydrolase [Myxococcales bacterium]
MTVLPAYEERSGAGPPIVLIHGALSSNRQWEPNLASLAEVGRPVLVAPFGHGASPTPSDPAAYRPESYVTALEAIRERLGASRWHMIGYSLGARVSLEYALAHPRRVLSHVVTNSMSGFSTPEWIAATGRGMSGILEAVRERGRAAIDAMPIHPKNSSRLDPVMREGLCRDLEQCDPLGVVLTAMHTGMAPPLGERLRNNSVPTLLTCGRLEKRFLPRRDWAAENVPELSIVDFDAAHAVNVEAAAAWNTAVTRFIRRHTAEP